MDMLEVRDPSQSHSAHKDPLSTGIHVVSLRYVFGELRPVRRSDGI